jgi:putative transposase
MKEYCKNSHSLFDLKGHIVWIAKYRKPVLYGEEALRLRELIRRICTELEVDILAGNVRRDHVHLLVSMPPQLSVSKLIQKVKGITSRKLLQESCRLQKEFWGKHLCLNSEALVPTTVKSRLNFESFAPLK